jgi:hypothetical protein
MAERPSVLAFLICASLWSQASALDDEDESDDVDSGRVIINVPEAEPPEEDSRPPLWMEVYSEATRSQHEDENTSGFLDAKVGRRIRLPLPIDFYAKARLYRDQADFFWNNLALAGLGVRVTLPKPVTVSLFAQVMTGSYLRTHSAASDLQGLQTRLDQALLATGSAVDQFQGLVQSVANAGFLADFAVNTSDTSAATRAEIRRLIKAADSTSFGYLDTLDRIEANLNALQTSTDSLRGRMDSLGLVPAGTVIEFQAGLVLAYGWGGPQNEPDGPWFSFPFRFWGDLYSDCIFQSLSRHVVARNGGDTYSDSLVRLDNLILYANPDVGLLLMEGRAGNVTAYATAYAWFDTHEDWWNNLFMAGPGLRWQPIPAVDFAVNAEYLWGRYYGRERKEDPLPYDRSFQDFRLTANFWYGLGL